MKQKAKWILFFSLLTALLLTALTSAAWDGAEAPEAPLRAVVLFDGDADPEQMESDLRDMEGVTFLCRYDTFFTGAAVEADAKTLVELNHLDGVSGVGLAQRYDCAASSKNEDPVSSEEGLALMQADKLREQGYTGDGVVIAVLDSGLNINHEAFADSSLMKSPALTKADITAFAEKGGTKGRYVSSRIPFAYDYYSRDDDVATTNNHGTHVTALAAGYARDRQGNTTFRGAAPAAQILSMKLFPNGSGGGTDDTIILRAMEDAWNLGADIINLSVGTGAGFSGSDVMNGVYCRAFTQMAESGVIICCAAGNSKANVTSKTWAQPLPTGDYTDYSSVCSPGSFYGAQAIAAASQTTAGTAIIADYSAWGPASGLHLTPVLTAFGGPVDSAAATSDTKYRAEEGTSMASPYAAGSFAVLLQAVRERGVTDRRQAAGLVQAMLESHTQLLTDSDSGLPVSPRRQGAGFIDLEAAVSGALVVTNPLIELGESEDGRFTLPVTLQNLSSQPVTVSLKVQVFTDDYTEQNGVFYSRMTPKDISGGVTVSGGSTVTVPAEGTATATLKLSVSARLKQELKKAYPNGFYVEGYVTASGGGQSAHGAFLGYCGDWSAAPAVEPADFRDVINEAAGQPDAAVISTRRRAQPEDMDACLEALDANTGASMAFLSREAGGQLKDGALLGYNGHADLPHDDKRNAMPSGDTTAQITAGGTLCLDLYTQRNAAAVIMLVSDAATGDIYYAQEELLLEKSQKSSFAKTLEPAATLSWDGTDTEEAALPAGTQVRVDVYAWLDTDTDVQAAYSANVHRKSPESYRWLLAEEYSAYRALTFPVTLDGAAPTAAASLEGNTLTLIIQDDQYAAYASVLNPKGEVMAEKAYAPSAPGESCTLVMDFIGVMPDAVYIQLEDYAANTAGYSLDLKAALSGGGAALERCASILFQDVKPDAWYHDAVDYVVEAGAMDPDEDGFFRPNQEATRWEIVAALYQANGSPNSKLSVSDLPFHDVPGRARYAKALCWAYEQGLVAGHSDGAFYGTANVTRQQLALMLYRCARLEGKDGASGDLSAFRDGKSVGDWAWDAMAWAVGADLIKGNESGNLAPTAGVTRAETAQILMRYMQMK